MSVISIYPNAFFACFSYAPRGLRIDAKCVQRFEAICSLYHFMNISSKVGILVKSSSTIGTKVDFNKRSSNSIIGHGESIVRLIWSALASPRLTALLMHIANSLASARRSDPPAIACSAPAVG